ncbi:MAG: NUDIX domain-containing protein [Pseudomonadota bacterium]|nr:NUDIX domain-containing protein [Pseudomonadota bacterium]
MNGIDDHMAVSTDVVLFSIRHQRLEVLLVRRADGGWGLPGGLAGGGEDLDASALRHLAEQTGVRGVYLEQLYTFGRPDRDPGRRVIAVAYCALVPAERLHMRPMAGIQGLGWFPWNQLPPLVLDHAAIVALAHRRLAAKLDYSTIALQFMAEEFTLSELQQVYETILGAALDKRNFRKRVLALGCIEATGALSREGNHRPARLFRVKTPGKVEFIK